MKAMVATAKTRSDVLGQLQASSGNGKAHRNLTRVLLLTAALSVVLVFPAWAAKWDLVPSLAVNETYTDNVSLASDAFKQSDWVTQVVPRILIRGTGPGLKLTVDYAPQLTYYARDLQDKNGVYQNGNATLNAELAEKLLFIDAGANVGQQNVSLQGPLSSSNVNTTGNRATVKSFYLSPYFQHDFGAEVRAELRYRYSATDSDQAGATQDSSTNALALLLASGSTYKVLSWGLDYNLGKTEYDSQLNPDLDSETILGRARYLITPSLGLLARGGYESYKRGDVIPESKGWGWAGGFDWSPSPRTNLTALTGRRFYGPYSNVALRHRARLLEFRAGYDESVTTTTQQFFVPAVGDTSVYLDQLFANTIPDPVARQDAVNTAISQLGIPSSLNAPVNYYSNNLFVQKRLNGSIALRGVRNTVIANVFTFRRQAIVGSTFLPGSVNPDNNTQQIGGSLSWSLKMTSRDGLSVLGAYSRNEFKGTSRVDDVTDLGIRYTRQFQPKFLGALSYRRQERDSTQGGANYTENAVIGTLQMSF